MSKRRTHFEMEIDVNFIDEQASFKHFVESDWKESFFNFDDLDAVAEHISFNFHNAYPQFKEVDGKYTCVKYIEGFGDFVEQENGLYRLTEDVDRGGDIEVSYEMELEPMGTFAICSDDAPHSF